MKTHLSPHDRFFKTMMECPGVAEAFMSHVLDSSMLADMDFSSMTLLKESMIEDSLRTRYTDLLFRVKVRSHSGLSEDQSKSPKEGSQADNLSSPQSNVWESGYIYVLVEHTSTPDKWLPFRLWKYTCGLIDRHLKDHKDTPVPLIVPCIVSSSKSPYPYSTDFFAMFGENEGKAREMLIRPFGIRDLAKTPDEHLSNHLQLGFMETLLKHSRTKTWAFLKKYVIDVINEASKEEISFILPGISYILHVKKMPLDHWNLYWEQIQAGICSKEKEAVMMTLEEYFMQQGVQQGVQQGMQQGVQQGILKGKLEVAGQLIAQGFPIDKVVSLVGLSLEELKPLRGSH